MKKVAGIPISAEDVKDYKLSYPPPQENEEAEPLELHEFKKICSKQRGFRRRLMYRIMRDCEARIDAMVQLRKRHFDTTVRPIRVTFPKSIVKKHNGKSLTNIKYVFQEDEEDLLEWLSILEDDELVFGTNEDYEQATNNERQAWIRIVEGLGFTERYLHNGYLKKNIHSVKAITFTADEEHVSLTYAHAYGDHALYTRPILDGLRKKRLQSSDSWKDIYLALQIL